MAVDDGLAMFLGLGVAAWVGPPRWSSDGINALDPFLVRLHWV
jgi:hypothetical protein